MLGGIGLSKIVASGGTMLQAYSKDRDRQTCLQIGEKCLLGLGAHCQVSLSCLASTIERVRGRKEPVFFTIFSGVKT